MKIYNKTIGFIPNINSNPTKIKNTFLVIFFLLLFISTPFIAASYGSVDLPLSEVFKVIFSSSQQDLVSRIIIELRLPRIVLAFIAGAGLSMAGYILQLVTRNPLADPYLFGISSGASFGAVMVMTLTGSSLISQTGLISHLISWLSLPFGAFIGAFLSVLLVLSLSGSGLNNQVERMLLAGVATSFMFGALSSLLLYFSEPQAAAAVLFWTLGSFAQADWNSIYLPLFVVSLSLVIFIGLKRTLLTLQTGDETAHTLGINVARLRLITLVICSFITATLVATCGGIGFIGLMIPHTIRLLFPGKQPLILTTLAGGIFMIWIDLLARTLLENQELPIGVITAAIGSIFFLFILRRRRQECHERI